MLSRAKDDLLRTRSRLSQDCFISVHGVYFLCLPQDLLTGDAYYCDAATVAEPSNHSMASVQPALEILKVLSDSSYFMNAFAAALGATAKEASASAKNHTLSSQAPGASPSGVHEHWQESQKSTSPQDLPSNSGLLLYV